MFAPIVCISALLLASCASRPTRAVNCDQPYASTIMECRRAQAAPDRSNQVQVCKRWGRERRCTWVDRETLRRQLDREALRRQLERLHR